MDKNFDDVICLMRNGIEGKIVVNGISFNQPMPPKPSLTDIELAEIATYIYNSWDHNKGIIETKEVAGILETCN